MNEGPFLILIFLGLFALMVFGINKGCEADSLDHKNERECESYCDSLKLKTKYSWSENTCYCVEFHNTKQMEQ